jgi:hypothetical protein
VSRPTVATLGWQFKIDREAFVVAGAPLSISVISFDSTRDSFEVVPEGIFEAHARLVSINVDGAFDD